MLLRGRDAEIDRGVILEDGRTSGALEICRLIENELATKACGRKSAARQRQQAALAVRYVHFCAAVSSRAEGLGNGANPCSRNRCGHRSEECCKAIESAYSLFN
jgi:hypothetical protein